MIPDKCTECGEETGYFFIMQKGDEIKSGICRSYRKKLEEEGWVVCGTGLL